MPDLEPSGRLSPAAIRGAVADYLANDVTIPDGHRGAIVTVANLDRMEIALATKINDHWQVELQARHEWTGGSDVGVMNKITW
jgi:hypothetical protein